MQSLEGQRIVVTGGSRGLGLGIVEALVSSKAQVLVVARDKERLADIAGRFGVATIAADVTESTTAQTVLRDVRPSVLILNAGATALMAPIHEQTWDGFSVAWDNDVRAGFHWIQAAIRLPLAAGSRVLVASSGAAVSGSPLSGGYAGAKKMLWFMAGYANDAAKELKLGIRFQAMILRQITAATELGRVAAESYAKKKGVSLDTFLAQFGKQMTPRLFGDQVVAILTDPKYENSVALGMRAETGVEFLD
jgi:NAD(P)-dependent dehydrogenase (short-subunit alcohol dehydrogenase family)